MTSENLRAEDKKAGQLAGFVILAAPAYLLLLSARQGLSQILLGG